MSVTILTQVTIQRGALHGLQGRVTAIYEIEQQVEVELDFLTAVITDISNVKAIGEQTKTPDVVSEVQH